MKYHSSRDGDTFFLSWFAKFLYRWIILFGFCLLFFLALIHLHLLVIPFQNYALAVTKKWRTLYSERSDNILSLVVDMRFWSWIFYFAFEHMRCCCSLLFAIANFFEFCPTLCMIDISMHWWIYTKSPSPSGEYAYEFSKTTHKSCLHFRVVRISLFHEN